MNLKNAEALFDIDTSIKNDNYNIGLFSKNSGGVLPTIPYSSFQFDLKSLVVEQEASPIMALANDQNQAPLIAQQWGGYSQEVKSCYGSSLPIYLVDAIIKLP